jgi:Domain of unknown function (DUF222)
MEFLAAAPEVPFEIERLNGAIARFCGQPLPEGGPALASFLLHLRPSIDKLEIKFSEVAAAFAETDEYDQQGCYSPIHWIRLNCHMSAGAAGDRVAVGEQLASIPESHQSLVEGEIGFPHLAHVARTAAAIEETGTNKRLDEKPLLEKARDLTVGRFIDFCHHMRHAADPEGYAAEQAQAAEGRSLTLKTGEGGMVWLRGVFDPEGAAVVRTALEPLAGQRIGCGAWEPAAAPAGHCHARNSAAAGGRAGCGPRVLAADLSQGRRAVGLRLQRHAHPARRGLGCDRRRPLQARDLAGAEAGAQSARQGLPLSGLRPAGDLDFRPSPDPLVQRRSW